MRRSLSMGLLIAVLAFGGCAAGEAEGAEAVLASESVIVDESLQLVDGVDLQYVVALVDGGAGGARVSCTFRGSLSGESAFSTGDGWGGVREPWTFLRFETVRGVFGREREVWSSGPGRWLVRHAPGEVLAVDYRIAPLRTPVGLGNEDYYKPIICSRFCHLLGGNALLRPDSIDERRVIRARWSWLNLPEGWQAISSWAARDRAFVATATFEDFRQAVFMAGPIRIVERDVKGGKLFVGIAGEQWSFGDDELAGMTAAIVDGHRRFFSDYSQPFFAVTLLPIGEHEPRSRSLGGTGLRNSFSLFITPHFDMKAGTAGAARLKRLLSHELFHNWNGDRVSMKEPERLVYWFSEGFTDFFSLRALARAGLMTAAEYADAFNETLRSFYGNPKREAPNAAIAAGFWSDSEIQKLPYQRGAVVAALVDREIRRVSAGRRNLDDLMRVLVARAESGRLFLTTEDHLATIERWTSIAFAESVRKIVVDGAIPELPGDVLGPVLELRPSEVATFDLGFEADAAFKAGAIVGVREGSAAHAAGLRNGQRLHGYSATLGDPSQPAEMTVEIDGVLTKLAYLPRGPVRAVPQFHVVPGREKLAANSL